MSDASSSVPLQHLSCVGGRKPKVSGEVFWRAGDGHSLGTATELPHVLPTWVRASGDVSGTWASSGCSLDKRKRQWEGVQMRWLGGNVFLFRIVAAST